MPLHPDDIDKTTFTSHLGTLRYTRMPFGLKNSHATFQRVIDVVLSSVKWQFDLFYIGEIIIFSRSSDDHFRHLRQVFTLVSDENFSMKLNKCFFFSASSTTSDTWPGPRAPRPTEDLRRCQDFQTSQISGRGPILHCAL